MSITHTHQRPFGRALRAVPAPTASALRTRRYTRCLPATVKDGGRGLDATIGLERIGHGSANPMWFTGTKPTTQHLRVRST